MKGVGRYALFGLSLLMGCTAMQVSGAGVQGGKTTGKTVNGVAVPVGTVQAWQVNYEFTIDSAKYAREAGGTTYLFRACPPSISKGTSSNQEVKMTLTCDGRSAQEFTDDFGDKFLLLEIKSSSGPAKVLYSGVVFNRNVTNVQDGGETLSKTLREKYLKSTKHINHEDPGFRSALSRAGLIKNSNESATAFASRALVWLVSNAKYEGTADNGPATQNPTMLLSSGKYNCNSSSAAIAAVLRANGIPTRVMPRMFAQFNGGWDFHADIAFYDEQRKLWCGVSPAGALGGGKGSILKNRSSIGSSCFQQDIDPGYQAVMIDASDTVSRVLAAPLIRTLTTNFNTEVTFVGTSQKQTQKVENVIKHTIKPLIIK
jgi:hypothetical protein